MSIELLGQSLSQLGDAPHVVQLLRKVIVAFAVSNRLNGCCPHWDKASMLGAIEDAKSCLDKASSARRPMLAHWTKDDELPSGFRFSAEFFPLGYLARIEKGSTGIKQAKPGSFPLVVTAAERQTCDHFDFTGPAAIVPLVSSTGHGNASLNRLHYQEGKFALGSILAAILPHDGVPISTRFIYEYLTAFKEELLVSRMTGSANVTLTVGRLAEVPIPLVAPEVQRTVDELMALCDRLEAARAQREATRDRLAAASLARLNAPDPDTFRDDARFALDALPALTTRPDQIKQLRQTILNLAVRGKLVPQDPRDEDGSVTIQHLRRSYKGPTRRGVPTGLDASSDIKAWQLPPSWIRISAADMLACGVLFDLKDGNHGANHPKVSEFSDSGLPFITAAQVQDQQIDLTNAYRVAGEALKRLRVGFAKRNDVIYTHKGSVGRLAVAEDDCILSPQTTYYRPNPAVLAARYLMWFMASGLFADQVNLVKKQTTRDFVAISKQYEFWHAIPPLAEQHRIVAKVDELMVLCDQLEASLAQGDTARRRLLDALLAEALVPEADSDASEREAEAANV